MTDQVIELGDTVKDRITGYTGVVTTINSYLYSSPRIGVRSKELHNGIPVMEQSFDEVELEIVEKQTIKMLITDKPDISFMDLVEDTVTGFKGKVVGIAKFLTGCFRIGVQSEAMKDGSPVNWQWFPDPQIKVLQKKEQEPVKRLGGPMPTCNRG